MPLNNTTSSMDYVGDGATDVFPVPFRFLNNGDLAVYRHRAGLIALLTQGVDYTVIGSGADVSASVNMVVPPLVDDTLTIERVVPLTQEYDFRTQGSFDPALHTFAMDKLTMMAQQLDRAIAALEDRAAVLEARPVALVPAGNFSFSTVAPVGAPAPGTPGFVFNSNPVDRGPAGWVWSPTAAAWRQVASLQQDVDSPMFAALGVGGRLTAGSAYVANVAKALVELNGPDSPTLRWGENIASVAVSDAFDLVLTFQTPLGANAVVVATPAVGGSQGVFFPSPSTDGTGATATIACFDPSNAHVNLRTLGTLFHVLAYGQQA